LIDSPCQPRSVGLSGDCRGNRGWRDRSGGKALWLSILLLLPQCLQKRRKSPHPAFSVSSLPQCAPTHTLVASPPCGLVCDDFGRFSHGMAENHRILRSRSAPRAATPYLFSFSAGLHGVQSAALGWAFSPQTPLKRDSAGKFYAVRYFCCSLSRNMKYRNAL
jgi:hypothetical protein